MASTELANPYFDHEFFIVAEGFAGDYRIAYKARNNNPGLKVWILRRQQPIFSYDEDGPRLRDTFSGMEFDELPKKVQKATRHYWNAQKQYLGLYKAAAA